MLGRFGLPKRGSNGNEHDLKRILDYHDPRVSTTCSSHPENTYTSFSNMKGLYQIDHFITSNSIWPRITETKRVETGVDLAHSANKLKMCLKVSLKCQKKYKAPRKIIPDWDLLKDSKIALAFRAEVDRRLLVKEQRKTVKSLNSTITRRATKARVRLVQSSIQ
jgi:hypothetical protein